MRDIRVVDSPRASGPAAPLARDDSDAGVGRTDPALPAWDHGWTDRSAKKDSCDLWKPRLACAPHVHPTGADPELLHHRAHRPRQIHPGRPDAAAHRGGRRSRHARPVPRPDGHRARARHHHQVPGRAAAVGRPGRRRRAHRSRAEPDRHPRARRLHLRGVPVAGRLRGGGAAGRRRAGHRGADPGEPVPGAGERPARHPGAEQDRPAGGPARAVRGGDRAHRRRLAGRRAAGVRQDRGRRQGTAGQGGRGDPASGRRRRRAGPGDDLRLGLRHLPRRHHLHPGDRRQDHPARADPDDVHPRDARTARGRRHLPGADPDGRTRCRRGRLPDHRGEGRPAVQGR